MENKDVWIAWAAGLFEGEGSVYMARQVRSNGKTYTYRRMQIKMTDLDVLEKFQEVVGCGKIHTYDPPSRKAHWKIAHSWYLNNEEECSNLIDKFWPYLGKRRRAKIMELEL